MSASALPLEPPNNLKKERTKNSMGSMFHTPFPGLEYWHTSLAHSPLPLLDAGACYGVHTLAALAQGRDVIALDMEPQHLSELSSRVEQQAAQNPGPDVKGFGKLQGCVAAVLPDKHAVPDGSVAGVLLSEVLHFCKPGEPFLIILHAFQWLAAGGRLVVSTAGCPEVAVSFNLERGRRFNKGRNKEQVLQALNLPDEHLVREAVVYVSVPDAPPQPGRNGIMSLHLLTTQELSAMARLAGFHIIECRYYSGGKYGDFAPENECALLVAAKPA